MKRRKFLITSLLALPVASFAKQKKTSQTKPFAVEGGKDRFGEDFLYKGNHFYLKVSGTDTDGQLCVYDTTRVKKGGPRLHLHYNQDEWFFVMKGEFTFHVGDTVYKLKEGDSLFAPRQIPHAFALTSEGEGRLMITYQPAGSMEAFFKKVRTLENPTEAQLKQLFQEHGMELLGSPIE